MTKQFDLSLTVIIAFAFTLAVGVGCAQKQARPWTPQPRVAWDHLSTTPVFFPENGFTLVSEEKSLGRFPAALAVSRVAVRGDVGGGQKHSTYIPAKPKNEYLQWNAAFDDQMALSEVFPIANRDLGGGPAEPEQIVAACHALHARLALVYAVNELSPTEAEMIGVLYETDKAKPIATFHAFAKSLPPGPEQKPGEVDPWTHDARALVRQRFERHVYECMRTLIRQDIPTTEEVPAGWMPAAPVRSVEWPPRQFRSRPLGP